MTTYPRTKINYRKIWENHFGPIPKDDQGRSYEIHHIDGDRNNNDISNFLCCPIQEHYDIHYSQGDWGACLKIAKRMALSPKEISELATKSNLERARKGVHPWQDKIRREKTIKRQIENGTHPFMDPEFIERNKIKTTIKQKELLEKGIHVFQNEKNRKRALINSLKTNKEKIKKGIHHLQSGEIQREYNLKRVKDGTHPLLGSSSNKRMLAAGKHSSQKHWKCEHCGVSGKGSTNYKRWHGDNCKSLQKSDSGNFEPI